MKKSFAALLVIVVAIFSGENRDFLPDYSMDIPEKPSGIGTNENPQARAAYEVSLLMDPSTGRIPEDIRRKELVFSRTIQTRASSKHHRIAPHEYEPAGPFNVGGRTRATAFDIRDEETIMAGGVSGGMWKSTDGGSSWRRTSDPTNRNSISTLTQDIRNGKEHIWYHGTGELIGNSARSLTAPYRGAGIYKSTDNGDSWQVLEATDEASPDVFASQFQYIWNIEINHLNTTQDEVLVAAYGGILRSLNGGQTWEVQLGQKLFDLPEETDLNASDAPFYTSLRKTSSGLFIATLSSATATNELAVSAGIYFSADGETWEKHTPEAFPQYHERTVMGWSADEKQFYFLTEGESVSLWRFDVTASGTGFISGSWTDLSDNIPQFGGDYGDYFSQEGYNMVVDVHPEEPEVVFIGGTNLYRSTDGFTSDKNSQWIGGYHPDNSGAVYPGHYPDQHLLLFYPSDASKMLCANDGGLRTTRNNLADSVKWTSLNRGYVTSQFYTIAQQKNGATDLILGGMQDNGSYLRDAVGQNPSWTRILGGDGGFCAITPYQNLMYVSFQESQIYRLELTDDNQIRSFARVDPVGGGDVTDQTYLFINPFVLDPINPNRMFLAGGDVIWRNENMVQIPAGSQTKTTVNWTKLRDTRLNEGIFTALEKSPTEDILYAGTLRQFPIVLRIEEASSTDPEIIDRMSPLFPQDAHISCVAVNPEDADHIVVVFSNYHVPSLFMSTDGGAIFDDISGNLEQLPDGSGNGPSVRWVEIIPTAGGIEYFAGTSTGLYSTMAINGAGTVWRKEGNETIGDAVIPMMDYRDKDGRMVVATHGNGTFRMFLENARLFQNQPDPGARVALRQNYPNPFSNKTTIEFTLPSDEQVQLDIYNSNGQLIRNLLWGPQFAGKNRVIWDGTNAAGVPVTPGIYHYQLTFRKIQLIKPLIYLPI